jgi:hypothetical protein
VVRSALCPVVTVAQEPAQAMWGAEEPEARRDRVTFDIDAGVLAHV